MGCAVEWDHDRAGALEWRRRERRGVFGHIPDPTSARKSELMFVSTFVDRLTF